VVLKVEEETIRVIITGVVVGEERLGEMILVVEILMDLVQVEEVPTEVEAIPPVEDPMAVPPVEVMKQIPDGRGEMIMVEVQVQEEVALVVDGEQAEAEAQVVMDMDSSQTP
jgi:hypothetical protein